MVLVRRTPEALTADVTPPGMNVRSRVHEYGGGAFTVRGGTVVFAEFADGRLWRQDMGTERHRHATSADARRA